MLALCAKERFAKKMESRKTNFCANNDTSDIEIDYMILDADEFSQIPDEAIDTDQLSCGSAEIAGNNFHQ